MQEFECQGLWELPGAEASPTAGTLRVSRAGELRLSLIGSLGVSGGLDQTKKHSVILGNVEGPHGDKVTLDGCFVTRSTFGSHTDSREEYRAQRGFFGAHITSPADVAFRRMHLQVGGLRAWAHSLSGLRKGDVSRQIDEEAALLYHSTSSPLGGSVEGGEISLGFGLTSSSTPQGYSFTEQPGLTITFETPLPEGEINRRFIYPLQNLMTLVCDRAQEIQSVSLWREDIFASTQDNPEIRLIAARVFPETEDEKDDLIHPHQLLFRLSDIEDEFARFVDRWLHISTSYADACNIYFSFQYGPPALLELAFLGMIESLALYYTRREDGVKHRKQEDQRLKDVLGKLSPDDADWVRSHIWRQPFPPVEHILAKLLHEQNDVMKPLMRKNRDALIADVLNTLNYVVRRDPELALPALHGAELYWMTAKLRILIESCLLRELGFRSDTCRSFFEDNGVYQHLCRAVPS